MSIARISVVALICCTLSSALVAVENSGTPVAMRVNGNVRYGPTTKANVIVTMKRGQTVNVFGPVAGKDGWYSIQFPRSGTAWIHKRVIMETAETSSNGKKLVKIMVDGANVRRDATVGSDMVTQVRAGEMVEWSGEMVADWYAIYPPNAVAYVYKSVLDMTATGGINSTTSTQQLTPRALPIENIWQKAKATYQDYYEAMQQDPQEAMRRDWVSLSDQLNEVVENHPHLRTQLLAQRLRNVIARVVQTKNGSALVKPETQQAAEAKRPDVVTPSTTTEQTSQTTTSVVTQQTQQPQTTVTPSPTAAVTTSTVDDDMIGMDGTVKGWLEPVDEAGIGASYAITGDHGMEAFVKVRADSDINLKDLHWRSVIVKGEVQIVSHEVSEEYRGVPLILIDEIRLAR